MEVNFVAETSNELVAVVDTISFSITGKPNATGQPQTEYEKNLA